MKINGNLDSGALDKLTKPTSGGRNVNVSSTASSAEQSAVAKLSGKFSELKAGESPFDASKVEQIRQAIKDGQFKVDAEAVADSIIASAKELIGNR